MAETETKTTDERRAVRFLVDFQGVLTQERFYTAGSVAEFDAATAAALVEDGRAELVEQDDSTPGRRGAKTQGR